MSVMREVDTTVTSSPTPRPARRSAPALRIIAISLAYLLVFLALSYVAVHYPKNHAGLISPWYLPQGLTFGLLLVGGLVYAPVALIATLASSLLIWHYPADSAIGVSLAATLGYALATLFARRVLRLDPRLCRLRDAFTLMLVAVVASLLVAALATAVLVVTGELVWREFGAALVVWWNGDLIGLLAVAPFILVHGAPWARSLFNRAGAALTGETLAEHEEEQDATPRVTLRGVLATVVWAAVIAGVVWLTMFSEMVENRVFYLCILVLIWLALQHGMRGTAAAALLFAVGAQFAVIYQLSAQNTDMLAELQIFILTLSLTGLLLGAVMSERRRTEGAVRASEDLLRTLIDAMPDIVIFKDGAGRWLAANDFSLHLFALDGTPYRGRTDAELAAVKPQYREALTECRRTDQLAWTASAPAHSEETIPQPDGTPMTFDVIKVPLFRPDGSRKGLVIIGRDITERKRAEDALDRERAYLSSAIDILPLPMAFLSPEGEWTQTNRAGDAFVPGLSPRQWLEGQLLTAETRMPIPRDEHPILRALQLGEVLNAEEVVLPLPDGRERPMLIHAGPITVGGTLVAVVAAFQDISAIKEAERAKDEFLGILSHELLTPLTDALGWTQAGRDNPENAGQALEIIEHNVRLLHRVVTDLLDLSRIIHGKLYLNREPSDLWKQAKGHADEFAPVATGRRRALVLEPPDEEMPVSLDRERLRQVLATLLDNALKGTEPGEKIYLTGRVEGDVAVLVIRDTGRGIPPESLDNFFTPFHQPQTVEPGRGMGLGMALVKGIIELHGGKISVDSPGPSQGSIFTIELPLRVENYPEIVATADDD